MVMAMAMAMANGVMVMTLPLEVRAHVIDNYYHRFVHRFPLPYTPIASREMHCKFTSL